jgi:hypothetical protein
LYYVLFDRSWCKELNLGVRNFKLFFRHHRLP